MLVKSSLHFLTLFLHFTPVYNYLDFLLFKLQCFSFIYVSTLHKKNVLVCEKEHEEAFRSFDQLLQSELVLFKILLPDSANSIYIL